VGNYARLNYTYCFSKSTRILESQAIVCLVFLILQFYILILPTAAEELDTEGKTTLRLSPESLMTISGSVLLTKWACKSYATRGEFTLPIKGSELHKVYDTILRNPKEIDTQYSTAEEYIQRYRENVRAQLSVPVKSFNCGNRLMEADMHAAIKGKKYPYVRYQHFGITVNEHSRDGNMTSEQRNAINLISSGLLELAGVKRKVDIELSLRKLALNKYLISGTKMMKMSDFDIVPPTALFGLIKASNDFVLSYKMVAEVVETAQ
jgi:hypothetical protein